MRSPGERSAAQPATARPDRRFVAPWTSNSHGKVTDSSKEWAERAGAIWTPDLADRSFDWIDRQDIDRYLGAWWDAHERGLPLLTGCRVRWPNGRAVYAHVAAQPKIAGGLLQYMAGITRFTLLD